MAAFFKACKTELGAGFAALSTLAAADWCYTKSVEKQKLDAVFTACRERSGDDAWKASASETLLALPLVRFFAETVVRPLRRLEAEVASLCLCCDSVDAFMSIKRGFPVGDRLLILVRSHLDSHKAAYGEQFLRPKHHYAWHNAARVIAEQRFLDTFVCERKHQLLKRAGTDIRNGACYERSVLGRVLVAQLRQLQDNIEDGLRGSTQELAALGVGASVAKVAGCPTCPPSLIPSQIMHHPVHVRVDGGCLFWEWVKGGFPI